ncbi:MAG: C4-dicarboxylate TRAP transporter large permease protein DctM [Candidatus Velthaea sp.]
MQWLPLLLVAVLILLEVPVVFAIGLGAALALVQAHTPLVIISQQLFNGLNSSVLLAIPFYMFTGAVMEASGLAERLIDLAKALVGSLRGGLGMVDIVASMFFADISGSATADTAAIGSVMMPGLKRSGYSGPFAAALQSSAGSLGLLFPPSICQIVYAYVAQVSPAKLFAASLFPGILVAVSFMVVNYVAAIRNNIPRSDPFTFPALGRALARSFWALVTPVLILVGIFSGIVTPTEAGVVAGAYVTIIGFFVYRSLTLRDMPGILVKTVRNTSRVMFLLGSALILGLYLVREQVPQLVAHQLQGVAHNPLLLLLLVNVVLIVAHTLLETIASIIVLVPVLLPVLNEAHVDPIHFGIILLVNSAIGINLPPVGFCLYIGASIAEVPLEAAARAILPFIMMIVIDLILVTLWPDLALWLPRVIHQ